MKAEEQHDNIENHDEDKWKMIITDQEKSGLKRSEYCLKHQLSYHRFDYWYRKLKESKPKPLIPIRIKSESACGEKPKIIGALIFSNGSSLEVYDKEILLLIANQRTC